MASSSSEYDGYVEQYCSVEREGRSLRAQLLAYDSKQDSFYVHYVGHDRRMDQWVSVSAVDLASASHELGDSNESPRHQQHLQHQQVGEKRRFEGSSPSEGTYGHQHHRGAHAMDPTLFARLEAEREEITKLKNVPRIQLGRWSIDAWYYSPYPEDIATGGPLYICEYTLKYMNSAAAWARHRKTNTARAPPGEQIYSDGSVSLWEVDGVHQELYCQNLCLLSKLFLDHKTLYFDVKPFLFYILTEHKGSGHELIGYFSKEKHSDLDYNLACILTLPPYQRCGYGKLLISCSYELTKREKKVGSPEKPISDLGKISYRSYWTFVLLSALQSYDGQWTIADLSAMTGIKVEDVISTLQALELIKHWKGQTVVVISNAAVADALAKLRVPRLCDNSKLTWQPPPSQFDAAPPT